MGARPQPQQPAYQQQQQRAQQSVQQHHRLVPQQLQNLSQYVHQSQPGSTQGQSALPQEDSLSLPSHCNSDFTLQRELYITTSFENMPILLQYDGGAYPVHLCNVSIVL